MREREREREGEREGERQRERERSTWTSAREYYGVSVNKLVKPTRK
jgi:hypothetical protein